MLKQIQIHFARTTKHPYVDYSSFTSSITITEEIPNDGTYGGTCEALRKRCMIELDKNTQLQLDDIKKREEARRKIKGDI